MKTIIKKILLIIIAVIIGGTVFWLLEPQDPIQDDPQEITDEEQVCMDSGGIVSTGMCCKSAGDFPDTCAIGACGCAPEYSHEVKICDCGENKCFDGVKCVIFKEKMDELDRPGIPQNETPGGEEPVVALPSETTFCSMSIGDVAKTKLLQLIPWTDEAVSLNVPSGWDVYTGGKCATKSILARDPLSELKQVFYFSEAGPVYTTQEKVAWDLNYIQMGGYNIPWLQSPLVNPLTSENYLINFSTLALTDFFQQAFPQVPVMTDVKIISSEEIADKPSFATDVKLVRAEFKQNNKSGEGSFYIVTADMGVGLGYGMMFIGITAPKGLLDLITPSLKKVLDSYTISQEYINACIQAQNKAAAGVIKAGKILSETSDTIMDVWENKLEAEERMSSKQSDATLGYSRLYNPDTDEVYEVTPEFYDHYQTHDNEFEISYLEELPDDKWDYVPLNGAEHIR